MFYNVRENVVNLLDDYCSIVSKAKHKIKHGKGLKILTP